MSPKPAAAGNAAASTSNGTEEHPNPNGRVLIQTPEAPTSLDELLRSPHNPAYHTKSSEPINGASPYDERRRNGFHLWRTESEDAKTARLRRVVEEAEAREANQWSIQNSLPGTWQRLARRCKSALNLSIYRETKSQNGIEGQEHFQLPLSDTKLTKIGLIALTISLAGAQLAWTLELAYGTPYLLSLGLSEQSTSLVWLAGPLSGLIAQPVVGSLSDTSTSPYRRRKYMAISAALLTLSTITLAYSVPISIAIVDFTGGGLADWDPKRNELVQWTTQVVSIAAFWILDFALNGLQAASRALILDTAPSEQQSVANAWHGRMTHTGNVVGYLCGWLDLASWQGLSWLGGGQFRRFALVSILGMLTCVTITITSIQEKQTDFSGHDIRSKSWFGAAIWQQAKETTQNVWHAIRRLPRPVRRICLVQMFAFMGWFPFLFYGTTYVLQTAEYHRKLNRQDHVLLLIGDKAKSGEPSSDRDAERGSFAMLLFALVALTCGALLPYLSLAGEKRRSGSIKLPEDEQDQPASHADLQINTLEDPDSSPLLAHGNEPKISFGKRVYRGLRDGLTLRTLWTLASLFFAALMLLGTVWAQTVHQVTILIALVGLPWSVAAWAPFAMVGEFVREAETGVSPFEFDSDHWSPTQTRARTKALEERALRKARRESIRSSAAAPTDDVSSAALSANAETGSVSSKKGRGSVGIRYINPQASPHARRLSESHGSPIRTPTRTSFGAFSGEEGAKDRLRASLVDCAPLPKNLNSPTRSNHRHYPDRSSHLHNALDEESDDDYDDDLEEYEEHDDSFAGRRRAGGGGGGTILGIHNLAIVTPQFIVAIISSLIFKALDPSSHQTDGIHLVLGQSPVPTAYTTLLKHGHDSSNPAEGTIWVLRFGGFMALFAALCTRFVPLTLSERKKRFLHTKASVPEPHDDDLDAISES